MRARNETVLQEVLPPEERVIEAVVARYQRVAPAITRFARVIAGDDGLRIRLGSHASASEGEVVIDPGVFQAAYARSAPVTPAEVALASALHEVVHLVATNLDETRPIPPEWLPEEQEDGDRIEVEPEPEPKPIQSPLDLMFPEDMPQDDETEPEPMPGGPFEPLDEGPAMSLLDALDTVGGMAAEALFFTLEDARQEARYLAPYPGALSVLADLYTASVPQALAQARPLGQFALCCFLMTGRYLDKEALQRRTDPHVAQALDEAAAFIDVLEGTEDPWDVGGIALQLLAVAKRHQLVQEAAGVETANQTRERQDAEGAQIADSVDAVRLSTPILQDAEQYEDTRQASQSVSAESGRKDEAEQAGDPATEQILKISEAPTIFLPTGQAGKLVVAGFPDRFRTFGPEGRATLSEAAAHWGVAQHRVSGELFPLFAANQRRGLRSGFDAGDLSPHAALLLGAGLYERMFERRDRPVRRSYGVSLLVDGSASMLQPRPTGDGRKVPWALAAATLGAWTLARLCDELQIEFEIALFNRAFAAAGTDSEQSFTDRRHRATGALKRTQGGAAQRLTRTVNHYVLKSFDERWRTAEDVLAGLFWMASSPAQAARAARTSPDTAPPVSMFDKAANVDEFNLTYAAQRLTARRVGTKILVVLADGMTRGSVQDLADSVGKAERGGTVVLGIGIGDATVEAAYDRSQVVERPRELATAMVDGVRSSLFRTIAGLGGDTWWAHGSGVLYDRPFTRSA